MNGGRQEKVRNLERIQLLKDLTGTAKSEDDDFRRGKLLVYDYLSWPDSWSLIQVVCMLTIWLAIGVSELFGLTLHYPDSLRSDHIPGLRKKELDDDEKKMVCLPLALHVRFDLTQLQRVFIAYSVDIF